MISEDVSMSTNTPDSPQQDSDERAAETTITQESDDSQASSATPVKVHKTMKKWVDRLLNVLVILALLSWGYEKLGKVPKNEQERKVYKEQQLERDAAKAFGKKTSDVTPYQEMKPFDDDWKPQPPEVAPSDAPAPVKYVTALDVYNIIEQEQRPVVLFVFASWCKYCNLMFPLIDESTMKKKDTLRIVSLSIDEDVQALVNYLERKVTPPQLTPYNFSSRDELRKFAQMLGKKGLQFNGSVPYMTVFYQQAPLAQLSGFLEPDKLMQVLEGAETLNKQQDNTQEKTPDSPI
jgi:thiol-disulfide isomerase/thioredoxin